MSRYNHNTSSALKLDGEIGQVEQGVKALWADCLLRFGELLEPREIDTWFQPIVPLRLEGTTLTIRVPTIYFLEKLESHYSKVFSKVLTELLGSSAKLCYEALVDSSAKNLSKGSVRAISGDIKGQEEVPRYEAKGLALYDPHLIKNYTFETFISSVSNHVPRTFALHICDHPGTPVINPFFIFGAPGVGKTHLLNAIGHQLLVKDPSLRILYVSTDSFVQQFTSAACNHKTADFTKYYRQVDVLLMDDIQTLIGKNKTQEAFFQIFNHLYMLGKQIVFTCDKPPVELQGMEERLVSRLAGSCIAQIERPDEELRRLILERKLAEGGIVLRKEVKELIISSVSSNLRELDGAITSLMLHSIVDKRPIDLKFAKEIIGRTVKMDVCEVTLDLILEYVCEFFKLTPEEIRGKSRKQELVIARQIVMYLCKCYTDDSYTAIGLCLGNRSHSTIVHGVNAIKEQREVDPYISDCVKSIEERLGVHR